ncbi:methionine aminopeptidase 1D, mitochondrial [Cylas formicarius]|uniref:methionine aminopeptidase 1D, mitochondrial n=1 Tax=Cylas formicarius TaxID=197179 RepID=UPI002958CC00|nr:methionine aminopeptidase 1D, mitochondrial [Cylas formicarius]XP_060536712.1 methionine aminopeptidase 1D, mitochondrial [Cylas formicarius]XP_060536713.1 methionine aminopeptidase 1D, mitochondrial [Cylas formicarius]
MRFNNLLKKILLRNKRTNFGNYELVYPKEISPRNHVPDHIQKPSYFQTGNPSENVPMVEIKTDEQIKRMKKSCILAANILHTVGEHIKIGQTTDEIDKLVHELTIKSGAYPSPLNYKHFPKSVCTSVNNVACHGIPDSRQLEDGDVVNVDVTVFLEGYHGDCSRTFLIGNVDYQGKKLVEATETCLNTAIGICKSGEYFRSIGACIEEKAGDLGFQVIPAFIGHGIGDYFHGPPDIYHISNDYPGTMEAGMTFTIEPILTQGEQLIEILDDDWTAVTADSARTVQFEHTILVTSGGAEVLTLPSYNPRQIFK